MTTSSVRWPAVKAIISQLQHAPALLGVDVFPAYPGDEAPPAYICFTGHIEGTVSYPTVMAGRLQHDDEFTLTFGVRLQQQLDADSTMTRLGEITTAINDLFAANPGLDGLDGDVAALVARVESWGPNEVRSNGWYADAEIDVQVTARIL